MGAKIHDVTRGQIHCEADKLRGCDIYFDYPSVGATENAMLAAVSAEGETYVHNAAREPEIVNLQNYLLKMGVKISGAGTNIIRIKGLCNLKKEVYQDIIPDRIVAGTYMVASAITGGKVVVRKVIPEHLSSIISHLKDCGCEIKIKKDYVQIWGPDRLEAIDTIKTLPYPGFPTDMQSQFVSLLSIAQGTSIIIETIFDNRFKHVDELIKMGAKIRVEGRIAIIKGVEKLSGANVSAWDLRGGAALILAGLSAEGDTVVSDAEYIDRGYDGLEKKLSQLGASIKKTKMEKDIEIKKDSQKK